MATHLELFQLVDVALRAIKKSLDDGDTQGYKEKWREQTVLQQLNHADQHIVHALYYIGDPLREELQHALIRIAMALHQLNESPKL